MVAHSCCAYTQRYVCMYLSMDAWTCKDLQPHGRMAIADSEQHGRFDSVHVQLLLNARSLLNTMKLINAFLNEKQLDNFTRLFDIAMENAVAQDAIECQLLPEEIDELKEILIR